MNRQLAFIILIILIAFLTSCTLFGQSNAEIATFTSQANPPLQPSPTFPSNPTPQITLTQASQPEGTLSPLRTTTSTTVKTGPLSVANQIYLGVPVADVLPDPASARLYIIDVQGGLKVLGLSDYKEISHLETTFDAKVPTSAYSDYSGKLLSIDPSRNRLYISSNPFSGRPSIFIVDTISLTITEYLDLSGQLTADPTSNRVYFTVSNGDGENCGTQILNADTWKEMGVLYPFGRKEPPPRMGPCNLSTRLDIENQILYTSTSECRGGSSCGLGVALFNVSETPQHIGNVGAFTTFDPIHKYIFSSKEVTYGQYSLRQYEIHGQTITRTLDIPQPGEWRKLFYDPTYGRLYAGNGNYKFGSDSNFLSCYIFDGNLALIAKTNLPGYLLAFDPKNQRLYAGDEKGNLFVIFTGFDPK